MSNTDPILGDTEATTSTPSTRKAWKRPAVLLPVGVIAVAMFAVAMYLFQPWALFTNVEVDEALPEVTLESTDAGPATGGADGETNDPPTEPPSRTTLKDGTFVSQAHPTEGSAQVIQLADGRRVLRLEDFQTDNGPDLKVWLSSRGAANADSARDGEWISLGELKGNVGNQNYWIEDDVDLSQYKSVLIWCDRFSVSFGAADLKTV